MNDIRCRHFWRRRFAFRDRPKMCVWCAFAWHARRNAAGEE